MIHLRILFFSVVLCAISINAYSEEREKNFNLGLASYGVVIAYDQSFVEDDDFSGFALNALYAFTDNFAVRGEVYFLENDDFSSVDATGIDLLGYFGTGLATNGFKAYIGGGIFSENIEGPFADEDFNGLQINGGIGYNWTYVALDFSLAIRDPSDYEDFSGLDAVAASGSLALSARF